MWDYKVVDGPELEELRGNVFAFFSERLDGGDILGDRWDVDTLNCDNNVRLVKWDTISRRIEGEFSLTFILPPDEDKINPANPDTVKFENGTFWGTY